MTPQERIERYADDRLGPAERAAFEQQLAADPELRAELDLHTAFAKTFGDPEAHQLREVLCHVDAAWTAPAQRKPRSVKSRLGNQRWWAAAASIILLVAAGWWTLQPTPGPLELYAEYAAPYEVSLSTRGTTGSSEALEVSNAEAAYFAGDYERAAAGFAKLRQSNDNPTYAFYYAVASLLSENADSAVSVLQDLVARQDHLYIEQARWYLGLAHLQLNQAAEAQAIFEQINAGAFRATEATELHHALAN